MERAVLVGVLDVQELVLDGVKAHVVPIVFIFAERAKVTALTDVVPDALVLAKPLALIFVLMNVATNA